LRIGLVTADAARGLDFDEPPLRLAFQTAKCDVQTAVWDDAEVDWASFDAALLRSTWDYADRLPEFLAWVGRASNLTRVLNPLSVVAWNTDKHYLAQLAAAGVVTVDSTFIEPGADPRAAVEQFIAERASAELVVKPAVGGGSRDAERHRREELEPAALHAQRLLDAGRSVLLQPYLGRVDRDGETALIYFDGQFSHAVRKDALLPPAGAATTGLFAPEKIAPRPPGDDELQLAQRVIAALPFSTPLYARVDLIRDDGGAPCLLELELTEPSLFFAHAAGSAERFAAVVLQSLRRR
jgi:glutathione synthase/RimK-type ligase-like ATP-grasp enzyme